MQASFFCCVFLLCCRQAPDSLRPAVFGLACCVLPRACCGRSISAVYQSRRGTVTPSPPPRYTVSHRLPRPLVACGAACLFLQLQPSVDHCMLLNWRSRAAGEGPRGGGAVRHHLRARWHHPQPGGALRRLGAGNGRGAPHAARQRCVEHNGANQSGAVQFAACPKNSAPDAAWQRRAKRHIANRTNAKRRSANQSNAKRRSAMRSTPMNGARRSFHCASSHVILSAYARRLASRQRRALHQLCKRSGHAGTRPKSAAVHKQCRRLCNSAT